MTPDQYKIYKYVQENPNSKIDDVIAATGLSRSLTYKILRTHLFVKTKIKSDGFNFMVYVVNDNKAIAQYQTPKHHEIHQAFWGMAA